MVGTRQAIDPASLMAWVAGLPSRRRACLECGAGSGEVAGFLSARFGRVAALNLVPRHLGRVRHPVQALCGDAAALPIASGSLDLVISLQSLHHFAVDRHLGEARRVLRNGGVFAALCWGRMRLPDSIAPMYEGVFKALEPYWEDARAWVLDGYPGLVFDGRAIALPSACMTRLLTLDALDLTIARWSAAQRGMACGADIPDPAVTDRQRRRLGEIPVSWPLLGRVFRVKAFSGKVDTTFPFERA